jgi:tRNA-specific 2-thiouridylase
MRKTALIGMSGGVDSSVAAYLTQQAGFHCIGGTMRLFDNEVGACGSIDHAQDAQAVANRLGMEFHMFDMTEDFRSHVMDHFVSCY